MPPPPSSRLVRPPVHALFLSTQGVKSSRTSLLRHKGTELCTSGKAGERTDWCQSRQRMSRARSASRARNRALPFSMLADAGADGDGSDARMRSTLLCASFAARTCTPQPHVT